MHEVFPELLAIGYDIDTGGLLLTHPHERSITLALLEFLAFKAPRGPQFFRFRKPGRFGQAAGYGCFEHRFKRQGSSKPDVNIRTRPGI